LTGAVITVLALAEPFIAAGAAVAFWFFFATEKELSPRGYERSEIIHAWWVPPSAFLYLMILNTKITPPLLFPRQRWILGGYKNCAERLKFLCKKRNFHVCDAEGTMC
jgi:hypothetical protein